jgi:N-acetylmuramic acid 6-phosphate (MurNAc-6-P) etherase
MNSKYLLIGILLLVSGCTPYVRGGLDVSTEMDTYGVVEAGVRHKGIYYRCAHVSDVQLADKGVNTCGAGLEVEFK